MWLIPNARPGLISTCFSFFAPTLSSVTVRMVLPALLRARLPYHILCYGFSIGLSISHPTIPSILLGISYLFIFNDRCRSTHLSSSTLTTIACILLLFSGKIESNPNPSDMVMSLCNIAINERDMISCESYSCWSHCSCVTISINIAITLPFCLSSLH